MPVVVQCPKCHAKLRGPDELAGKSVRCKGCREKFRVPGPDAGLDSMSETQQISTVGSSPGLPAVAPVPPVPAANVFVPAAIPSPGTAENPLPLDDLMLEESPSARSPEADALDAADLVEEPAPRPAADPFAFEEPAPAAVKPTKKRRPTDEEVDDDRPRKRRRPTDDDDEDERPVKRSYQKKSGAPWGLMIGALVALLAIGGGLAAVFLVKSKEPEEAKAKVEAPPAAIKPRAKEESKDVDPAKPTAGEPPPPTPPKPPVKKDPPPPPGVKLPALPTGKLTVVGKVSHQLTLAVPTDAVRAVQVAGTSAVVVFNSQPGFQGAGRLDTIRQYSVKSGAAGREFVIDSSGLNWPRAFAVSGDGEIAAVEAGGAGKVTVFDYETGTVLLDEKDVFAGATGRIGPVAALAVGTSRKLFVVDQAGTVDVWDLATGERSVTGTPPKRTGTGKSAAKACAISGGAAVAVALDGKVWVVDATGKTTGTGARLPAPDAVPLAIGPGPGDDRAAVAYRLPTGPFGVAGVHPGGGTVEYHTPLPDGIGPPVAVGWPDATLLSASIGEAAFLIDTEERAVTAYLKAIGGKVTLFPTGGEIWWLTADATDPKKSVLRAIDPRFDGYSAVAKQARAAHRPVYLVPRPNGLLK